MKLGAFLGWPMIVLLAVGQGWPLLADGVSPTTNLSDALESASELARGNRLCDRRVRNLQKKRFDHMYGARIKRLITAYVQWHGPDKLSTINVTSCTAIVDLTQAKQRMSAALIDFNYKLKSLEEEYRSPPKWTKP